MKKGISILLLGIMLFTVIPMNADAKMVTEGNYKMFIGLYDKLDYFTVAIEDVTGEDHNYTIKVYAGRDTQLLFEDTVSSDGKMNFYDKKVKCNGSNPNKVVAKFYADGNFVGYFQEYIH